MKRNVVLATFFRPHREIIDGEEVFDHPSFHRLPLLWLEASARADPEVNAHYRLVVESFDQDDPLEGCVRRVWGLAPAVVALSCHVSNVEDTLDFCGRLKLVLPDVRIVLGGPEACDYARLLDRHPIVDAVVLGEGEAPFTALLRAWIEQETPLDLIPGLAFRGADGIHAHEGDAAERKLAALESPYGPELVAELSGLVLYGTSRGCAHSCTYCRWQPAPRRFFPIEQVERELGAILANPEVKAILLTDAELDLKSRRTLRLLRFIRDHNPHGIKLRTFFDFLRVDEEGLRLCREAGFLAPISIGLQSTSPEALELAGRRWYRLDQLEAALPIISEFFPEAGCDVIYGLPGESFTSFKETLRWCLDHGLENLAFHRLMVMPGTELWKNADRYGLVFSPEVPHFSYATHSYSYAELLQIEALAESFQVLMSVMQPEDYEFLRARQVDLIEVMQEAPSAIPDWYGYFTIADEVCVENIDPGILEALTDYIRSRLGDDDRAEEIVHRLIARQALQDEAGDLKVGSVPAPAPVPAPTPVPSPSVERLAERLVFPCRIGQILVDGWTLTQILLEPRDGGGITYVFNWKQRAFHLKVIPRDDAEPRLSHSRNLNVFYPHESGDEGIPSPRREALCRAFARRIRRNDNRAIRWPWPRREA